MNCYLLILIILILICFAILCRCLKNNNIRGGSGNRLFAIFGGLLKKCSLDNSMCKTDFTSIKKLSFIPDTNVIQSILQKSKDADSIVKESPEGDIITKGTDTLTNVTKGFVENSILVKIASGKLFLDPTRIQIYDDESESSDKLLFVIMNDRNMPYYGASNGGNGVLVNFDENKYGKYRINLFYKDEEQTKKLLKDYIRLRNKNMGKILKQFVNKLESHNNQANFDKLKMSNPQQTNYNNVCIMFRILLENLLKDNDISNINLKALETCGVSCISFCQTWARNNKMLYTPEFSVGSPHFQTRFYVTDDLLLLKYLEIDWTKYNQIKNNIVTSYNDVIKDFDKIMEEKNYSGKNGPAFVNMDGLLEQWNQ